MIGVASAARRWVCRVVGHRRPVCVRDYPVGEPFRFEEMPPNWWKCERCGRGWLS